MCLKEDIIKNLTIVLSKTFNETDITAVLLCLKRDGKQPRFVAKRMRVHLETTWLRLC